jgi:hypothetical protein
MTMLKTKLSTALQPCEFTYIRFFKLEGSTMQNKEWVLMDQGIRLNFTANGEDYSLMWKKANFAVHGDMRTFNYS